MLPDTMSDSKATASQPNELGWQTPGDGSVACGGGRPVGCTFAAGQLAGRLDLRCPAQGVELSAAGTAANVLAVRLPPGTASHVDSWVRGRSAVAIHEPADSRRLRVACQWQVRQDPAAVTLELVLSTQTAATRSDGALAVDGRLAATEALIGITSGRQIDWIEPAAGSGRVDLPWQTLPATAAVCLLFRGSIGGKSLAMVVRRDEARQFFLWRQPAEAAAPFAVTGWFFPTLIEKGVLHRGRFQVSVGEAAADREWAAAAASRLSCEPPLLR